MTMALSLRHLPPELQAAKETLAASCQDALPTRDARMGRVLLYLVLLAIGTSLGAVLVSFEIVSPAEKDFWRAALTAVSVLSGFMITTMVFTGKIDAAKSLSLSELRDVASKVNYLLLYQIGTLANHLACLSLMLLVPAVTAKWPTVGPSVAILCLGLFFVSIVRSIFIPIQIIELHRFTHAALLRDKRDEAKASAGKM
jgi:hypothetical protein